MRDRLPATSDIQMAQLFRAFLAHTDLQLVAESLEIGDFYPPRSTDSRMNDALMEILTSRFTRADMPAV